ncbi:hypothetical protein HYPBUDRAFT_152667 [Hyphopichia burtonii NRRL Y-1933]|uniref:Uncharacterized protein n=1 Tax=Hyphopichia burtonii NRRL Y-1933 TaxID=984485 RepID=A0A1E4RKZ5_9ASCO|nr:hypothetical protein HYPBUDRAFT_152667 [Hyphopichia burtonii NRRL Y-1933]ODV67952.1 hypothetical protein HYPBUDRAFT_152667 [Hyphopichia burtonii NRRL Y-1933]
MALVGHLFSFPLIAGSMQYYELLIQYSMNMMTIATSVGPIHWGSTIHFCAGSWSVCAWSSEKLSRSYHLHITGPS